MALQAPGSESTTEPEDSTQITIQTDALTKRYNDTAVVSGLDIAIREGEVYGFLGPNGAGKSTTIDLLMDYTRPSSGSASIFGLDVREKTAEIHARTGILPDQFGVYGSLTGREHITYVLDANDATGDPATVLGRVGLSEAIDQRAGGYSKGMRQRLGLGMALAGDPELLILDEPFSGLDPNGVRLVRDLVTEERDRGTTVFFSSHVLDQVERVCDRVGLLAEGDLVAEGTPSALREAAGVETTLRVETDSPETAVTAAERLDAVSSAWSVDDTVVVSCPPDRRYGVLTALDKAGISVRTFDVDTGTIEDAFVAIAET
ncbi:MULTISPECIES: ABC transporter ATP-binding protein [Halobacterium]|uniref:ABC transporter ATP-binding protein n=1 Tax=Halobacterium TaxID=2239 RepID=UPI0019631202|nr:MULTISPECIES: ABC transporter ATP-binding protein [Halobacterium]MCF2165784.1 ABC transporter ATP-binding protein [Halobacterium salinarum]MCF2168873.1 ABC transporter ATP-binding protein [Halobacterium salinarum]QRY21494.1 ABC transporter ATP-binding protein [Halobacterium sp. GSL-19]